MTSSKLHLCQRLFVLNYWFKTFICIYCLYNLSLVKNAPWNVKRNIRQSKQRILLLSKTFNKKGTLSKKRDIILNVRLSKGATGFYKLCNISRINHETSIAIYEIRTHYIILADSSCCMLVHIEETIKHVRVTILRKRLIKCMDNKQYYIDAMLYLY